MSRYYVEFGDGPSKGSYIYIYAYSEQHVRDIFDDYKLIAVDQTDQESGDGQSQGLDD